MYAAGTATFRRPTVGASGRLRHAGRWLAVTGLIFATSLLLARTAAGGTAPATTVVVQPGDSLWSIAAVRYPGEDTRERVDAIERLNGLSGPVIVAGETLQLPPP